MNAKLSPKERMLWVRAVMATLTGISAYSGPEGGNNLPEDNVDWALQTADILIWKLRDRAEKSR